MASGEAPAPAADQIRIVGAWAGALEVDLDGWTVPMLRAEVARRRGARPRRPHLRRPRAQGRFPPVPAAGRTEGECQGAHHPHLPRSRQGNRRRGIKGQSRGAACQEARQTLVNIRLASSFSTKPLTRGLWRFQVSAPLFGDKITIITEKDTTLLSFEDSCAID
jgi:hypothetical protein